MWSVLVAILLVLTLRDFGSFQLGAYRDDAAYVVLARSLVDGPAYGYVNEPGVPGPARYPFGFPLMLSAVARCAPGDLGALRLIALVATCANAAILFWGWRRFDRAASHWWSLAVVGLYAVSPLVVEHARMVMSEPPFLTCCLLLMMRAESAACREEGRFWPLAMGTLVAATTFTRTVGIVFVAAALFRVFLARGTAFWRQILATLGVAVALSLLCVAATPVELRSLFPHEYGGYLASPPAFETGRGAGAVASRVVKNVEDYTVTAVPELIVQSGRGGWGRALGDALHLRHLPTALGIAVAFVIAFGSIHWYRTSGPSTALVAAAFYLPVLMVWPWRSVRFLYPVQPQLAFAALLGLDAILARRERGSQHRIIAVTAATILLVIAGAVRSSRISDTVSHLGDLRLRTTWMRAHAPASAVCLSEQPHTDFLYGGLRTVPYPDDPTPQAVAALIEAKGVDFVLVGPDLVWGTPYVPTLSRKGARMAETMDALAGRGGATLVDDRAAEGVRVFAIPR